MEPPGRSALQWMRLWALVWSGPEENLARKARKTFADVFLVSLALALPWSTTIASALIIGLVLAIIPTLRVKSLAKEIRRPALFLPFVLFLLAAVGTTWAFGVPWSERLHALDKMTKLLVLPLLFVHCQESPRASWSFFAFVLSNVGVLILSWIVFVSPEFAYDFAPREPGVLVKNYIDQSQAFAFLLFALSGLAAEAWRKEYFGRALGFALGAGAFFANLVFVNVARTAFVYLPVMLLLFAWRYLQGRRLVMIVAATIVVFCGLWAMSPNLQKKIMRIPGEVSAYEANSQLAGGEIASGAERLELWRKSVDFIRNAPLLGSGTGSIKRLFEVDAVGKTGLGSIVASNPHNQTLAVAIQWGVIGCMVLYAMWASHLLLFYQGNSIRKADLVGWIGLLAVVQNIMSSIFNSHLIDFYQGWLYVLVVGIAGGQLYRCVEPEQKRSTAEAVCLVSTEQKN